MPSSAGPDIIQNGLVLALDASDRNSYPTTGTSWFDLSGNGNTGTLTNGPTFNTGSLGNIVFDGVDDYCQLPNLNLNYPFVISFWGMQSDISSIGPHVTLSNPTLDNQLIILGINLATSSEIRIAYFSTTYTQANSTGYNLNQIYNVTGVFTSSGFDLYVNGQYKSTLSGAKSKIWTDTSTSYNLMRLNRVTAGVYKGTVYNTLIYNRALSASEILQNYNATRTKFGL
jgi:hypothetical protein